MDWLRRTKSCCRILIIPSIPFLPDPLKLQKNGVEIPIKTRDQWKEKEHGLKKNFSIDFRHSTWHLRILKRISFLTGMEEGTHIQLIELRFGPQHKAHMTIELMIPGGHGPFPFILLQWSHRNWAQLAVRRGYIGCVYAASDDRDDIAGIPGFVSWF